MGNHNIKYFNLLDDYVIKNIINILLTRGDYASISNFGATCKRLNGLCEDFLDGTNVMIKDDISDVEDLTYYCSRIMRNQKGKIFIIHQIGMGNAYLYHRNDVDDPIKKRYHENGTREDLSEFTDSRFLGTLIGIQKVYFTRANNGLSKIYRCITQFRGKTRHGKGKSQT